MNKKPFLLFVLSLLVLSACGTTNENNTSSTDSSVSTTSEVSNSNTSQSEVDEKIYEIYQLYLANGGKLSYEDWLDSIKGEKGDKGDKGDTGETGAQGEKGETGVSITSIEKTNTVGNVDTYTITLSNGETSTFTITNAPAQADENEQGLAFYLTDHPYITTGEKVYGVGVGNASFLTTINIPGTYKAKQVVFIATEGFMNKGDGTPMVQSLSIPKTIKFIDNYAFQDCRYLETVEFEENSNLTTIAYRAFYNCTSLTSITIPRNVTTIGRSAFDNCTSLTTINFEGTIREWEAISLGQSWNNSIPADRIHCSNGDYVLENSPENLGKLMFTLNSDNESYSVRASSSAISGDVKIPSKYNGLPVTTISGFGFFGCTSLISISIPSSVVSIESGAFNNCYSLTTIEIPDSVASIGNYAFDCCFKLVEVINKSSLAITAGSSEFGKVALYAKQVINDRTNTKLAVDNDGFVTYEDDVDVLLVSYVSDNASVTLPRNITKINQYAFYKLSFLSSVTAPESVVSIGDNAFAECYNLNTFRYNGTISSWNNVLLGEKWRNCADFHSIRCLDGDFDIGYIVWCDESVAGITREILEEYKNNHPDFTYSIDTIDNYWGSEAIVSNPNNSADVYYFTQDYLNRLVAANAISKLPNDAKATVIAENDSASLASASSNGSIYAYPVKADNTYFLYYDKRYLSTDDVKDLDTIVTKSAQMGKYFCMAIGDAWYNTSFFYGVGAQSEWAADVDGSFVDCIDTYKTLGLPAMKEMNKLAGSSGFKNGPGSVSEFLFNAVAVVSGIWDKDTAKELLGDNLGVAVLPSWKDGDNTYTLKPFTGYSLIGTKPQKTEEKSQVVKEIALALSGESAQLSYYTNLGWGPSNKAVQQSSAVQNDPVATVAIAQMATGTPQGLYPAEWWTIAQALGSGLGTKTETELNDMLNTYNSGVEALLSQNSQ